MPYHGSNHIVVSYRKHSPLIGLFKLAFLWTDVHLSEAVSWFLIWGPFITFKKGPTQGTSSRVASSTRCCLFPFP